MHTTSGDIKRMSKMTMNLTTPLGNYSLHHARASSTITASQVAIPHQICQSDLVEMGLPNVAVTLILIALLLVATCNVFSRYLCKPTWVLGRFLDDHRGAVGVARAGQETPGIPSDVAASC